MNLLTILFVGLKLTGYIDWSWWLVLMPSIVFLAITLLVGVVGVSQIARGNRW